MASIITQSGPLNATGVLWAANVAQEDGVSLHVVDSGGGSTIVAEVSDDNTTWTVVGAVTTTGRYFYAADNKYFRFRVSTFVSGYVRVGVDTTTVSPRSLLPTSPMASSLSSVVVAGLGSSSTELNDALVGGGRCTLSQGYITWACTLSKGGIWMPYTHNFGLGGDTTGGMLSRVPAVLSADPKPAFCMVHALTNDVATGVPFSTYTANLASIVDQLQAGGVVPVLMVPQPGRGDSTAILSGYARAHQWVRNFALSRRGVILVDALDKLVDPAGTTYESLATVMADTRHLNVAGAHEMGKKLWAQLQAAGVASRDLVLKSNVDTYDATNNPTGNLLANGMMTGTAGTTGGGDAWTGSLASSWQLVASLTGGVVTPAKVTSNGKDWQQFTFSGTSTSGAGNIVFFKDVSLLSDVSIGDKLEALLEVETDATSGIMTPAAYLRVTTAQGTVDTIGHASSTGPGPTSAWSGVIRTNAFVVPATPTTVRLRVVVLGNAGSNVALSGAVRFRAASIRKVI